MPIYEYECPKCGHTSELLVLTSDYNDKGIPQCPNCHIDMPKIMSRNTFHLKGSGWYATDYGSNTNTK